MKYCVSVIIVLMFSSLSFAGENVGSITKHSSKGDEIFVVGAFDKPGIANPGEVIFNFVESDHEKYKLMPIYTHGYTYSFVGRIGDKSLEIKKRRFFMSPMKKTGSSDEIVDTLKIFFENNSECELKFTSLYTNCGDNYAKLKMLELNGNSLKFKIILPDCLQQVK